MPSPEGETILELVRRQVSLGPRFPGSSAHETLRGTIARALEAQAEALIIQDFDVTLPAGEVRCANLIGIFGAGGGGGPDSPILLGTHYDTRLIADREPDSERRGLPIPGANDGGSGTAIFLSILPLLAEAARRRMLRREVTVAFFDAEDVGGIAGLPYSLGARHYARAQECPRPGEVLILDMVGGANLELDVDAYTFEHKPSLELTRKVFRIGRGCDEGVFRGGKLKYIICDHTPFREAGIATCLLIDLDYPQWHTHDDLPQAMSARSLATIADVVLRLLLEPQCLTSSRAGP